MRVPADLERLEPVRFQTRSPPHTRDVLPPNSRVLGHQPRTPVRALVRNTLDGRLQDLINLLSDQRRRAAGAWPVVQSFDAALLEPTPPFQDGSQRGTHLGRNLGRMRRTAEKQRHPGSLRKCLRRGPGTHQRFQFSALVSAQDQALERARHSRSISSRPLSSNHFQARTLAGR